MLVFSLAAIDFVKVKIDDGDWINCEQKEPPLFVAKWNPLQYLDGLHKIQIHVKDIDGREKIYSQPFLLDGNHLSFDVISRIILMMDASTIFKSLFGTLLGFTVLPLCILRILYELSKAGKIREINLRGGCFKLFIKKLWILCTVDRLFYPLVFYPLYLTFGPWSIGYLIEDYIGIVFAWGIFIHGTFLPGSFTYAYGFIQLLTFHVPLMFILSHTVYRRYRSYVSKSDITRSKICEIASHIPFCILFTLQAIMAYMFWLAYGTLAFILGPLRTWSVILAAILYYFALKLPEKCLLNMVSVQKKSDSYVNSISNKKSSNK